ncbi:hypothetical protein RFI_18171 [Reticulomyxa filosa]|uniref:Uncharacterized protein n=1 Tax=Reticulomyxa filosa TaxID=46433 RepID=X6MZ22_RETFI|nr:hypothetical protein RFI_18171 [Reticulomyxa filosa]|eukprot:ETO19066.1 hypothetical protein RFI_18171 [Reticulomyxa filosa]
MLLNFLNCSFHLIEYLVIVIFKKADNTTTLIKNEESVLTNEEKQDKIRKERCCNHRNDIIANPSPKSIFFAFAKKDKVLMFIIMPKR